MDLNFECRPLLSRVNITLRKYLLTNIMRNSLLSHQGVHEAKLTASMQKDHLCQ